jgi:hypothetical protein
MSNLPDSIEGRADEIAAVAVSLWRHTDKSAPTWFDMSAYGQAIWRDCVTDTFRALREGREEFEGRERAAADAVLAKCAPPIAAQVPGDVHDTPPPVKGKTVKVEVEPKRPKK